MTKKEIRRQMKQARESMDAQSIEKENRIIFSKLDQDPDFGKASLVAIFYPMGNEVNLMKLVGQRRLAFPKIIHQELHFIEYVPLQAFEKSAFGVMEPMEGDIVDLEIDYMIVPALAISKSGYRIGYGKGYYDQFLKRIRPHRVVGVIYGFQEIESFEIAEHDQPLDAYYTGRL
jgi:5-formyltetrahydrofolate cyclo-ligase